MKIFIFNTINVKEIIPVEKTTYKKIAFSEKKIESIEEIDDKSCKINGVFVLHNFSEVVTKISDIRIDI